MRNIVSISALCFFSILCFFSCNLDGLDVEKVRSFNTGPGVIVLNEGQFNKVNASTTFINLADNTITNSLYREMNNGEELGDIAQSISVIGNKGYIVMNNSGRIVVVNMVDFKKTATIEGLKSPNYITAVDNDQAYVSSLFGSHIYKVSLQNNTVIDSIFTGSIGSNQMHYLDGKLLVGNYFSRYLYEVDPVSNSLTDSVFLSFGPAEILNDNNGKLHILATGCQTCGAPSFPQLHRLSSGSLAVEQSIALTVGGFPQRLSISPDTSSLYYLDGGVKRMQISASQAPTTDYISANGGLLYGLGINPGNGDIWVGDAVDFQSNGEVSVYNEQTAELKSVFQVGVAPSAFLFF